MPNSDAEANKIKKPRVLVVLLCLALWSAVYGAGFAVHGWSSVLIIALALVILAVGNYWLARNYRPGNLPEAYN